MHRTAVRALVCLLLLTLAPLPAHAADRESPAEGAVLLPLEQLWHRLIEAVAPWAFAASSDVAAPGEPAERPAAAEVPPAAAPPTSDLGGTMDPDG